MDMTTYQWDDPLFLDEQLDETERMMMEMAKQFCHDKLMPRIVNAYRREKFDSNIMREMGEMGLLGSTISEEYGGVGASHVAYGLIAREVEKIDSGYRSAMSVQSSLVMHPIYTYGTDEQKEKYLKKLASGEMIGCFGLTEPQAGSDPAGMKTIAKKTDGGYILNGHKMWITNSPIADIAIIWAKLDGEIRGFIVETNMKGVHCPKIEGKLSLRASITGEVVLNDVFVPDGQIFPDIKGLKGPFGCLNKARFGIAWGALGAAEFCWHATRDYVLTRQQFNKPLAANQLVQLKLANMMTDIHMGYQTCLRVGRLLDLGQCPPENISMIKRNSCTKALEIARNCRDMHGANGIAEEFHIMRHLCNLETVNTYEGANDIHALILGRAQTGIQAFA
jgi:glutaryl-CoA dehydrogenase